MLCYAAGLQEALPSSEIKFYIRMVGQTCMYCFCAAVVLSLTCSVIVEFLDDSAREQADAADYSERRDWARHVT